MLHRRTTSIKQLSITMIGWMLALYTSISLASTESAPIAPKASNNSEATLSILNREIIHFRTTVLGIEPEERVKRAQRRIEQQLSSTGEHKLSVTDMPPGK